MRTVYGVLLMGLLGMACSSTSEVSPKGTSDRPVIRGFGAMEWTATEIPGVPAGMVDTVEFRGAKYLVQTQPIFTEQQIKAVRKNRDRAEITEFMLDENGTEALRLFTSEPSNIQHPIALRFGGRWVNFPILQSRIPNGTFIMVGLTDEEFRQAAKAFGEP